MSKKAWGLFIVLILAILFLSGTSSFLFFKNKSLNIKPSANQEKDVAVEATAEATTNPSPTATQPSQVKTTNTDRPSSPSDTYVIQKGETLFVIATKNNLSWTELMAANGLADADKIKAGQSIIIPKDNQIDFTVNQTNVATLTKQVQAGKYQFRLDPVETAKTDSSPAYGLSSSSVYALQDKDDKAGTATVLATAGDQKLVIKLIQPSTKGAQGIWAISSIAQS